MVQYRRNTAAYRCMPCLATNHCTALPSPGQLRGGVLRGLKTCKQLAVIRERPPLDYYKVRGV